MLLDLSLLTNISPIQMVLLHNANKLKTNSFSVPLTAKKREFFKMS